MIVCPKCGKTEKDVIDDGHINFPCVDIDIELDENNEEIGYNLKCFDCNLITPTYKSKDELINNESSWFINTF